jgi:hypothetical protein
MGERGGVRGPEPVNTISRQLITLNKEPEREIKCRNSDTYSYLMAKSNNF